MGRAVVAVRERCALARLPLPRGRATAACSAVERAGLDLLLDEVDRGSDPLVDDPGHLSLVGDREVAADILEERLLGMGEVARVARKALDRLLAGSEQRAAILELGLGVRVRVDQVLHGPIDRPRVLIHTAENPLLLEFRHGLSRSGVKSLQLSVKFRLSPGRWSRADASLTCPWSCYKVPARMRTKPCPSVVSARRSAYTPAGSLRCGPCSAGSRLPTVSRRRR